MATAATAFVGAVIGLLGLDYSAPLGALCDQGRVAKLLQVYADVVDETEPCEGAILAYWAPARGATSH